MTAIPCSADGAIAEFFAAHSSVTREQCEAYALSLAGGPVTPVALQGSFSYTVVAGNKQSRIIQFRARDSDLDRAVLDLAQRVHNEFVPSYTYHGLFCELLPVYGMDKVTGTPYVHVKPSDLSSETGPWHSKTVGDFARYVLILVCPPKAGWAQLILLVLRFFAAAWKQGQHLSPEAINAIKIDYETIFDLLSRRLPRRFQENLTLIRAGLPSLFDASYPLALNHGDLSGLNIFVDPSTGRITGIIDWAEATIGPFGMSLWGLENLLGFMDGQG
jgi:hypothetical protein